MPIKALDDAMLAWEMNGTPLSLAHGGPLRLIVPGYQGVNNIKYVKRLAFTAAETDAKIMTHGYRITPPGGKADQSSCEASATSWTSGHCCPASSARRTAFDEKVSPTTMTASA